MTILTYSEQLAAVQAVIAEVETYGQSATGPEGGQLTRADLRTLYARENTLRPLVAREAAATSGRRGRRRISYVVPTNG